jgi:hypothetical protein
MVGTEKGASQRARCFDDRSVTTEKLKGGMAFPKAAIGGYPVALAQSRDGHTLFVADASLDAVAVDHSRLSGGPELGDMLVLILGFIPTDWYPSALAVHGDDLLIATAKGEGTRPNKDMGKTVYETKHKEHPYIPTLLKGSIARLNIPSTLERLPAAHAGCRARQPFQQRSRNDRIRLRPESHQARDLHHQREPHLRSDSRRPESRRQTSRRRRPFAHHVRRRHHAQRAQTRAAVRCARQFL